LNDLDLTFTEWVKSKSEVATLINQLHSKPRQGLKIVLPHEVPAPRHEQTSHLGSSEDEIQQAIIDRVGDVLCTNTILKSDHFPGCQRKGLVPRLSGAPNFRRVDGLDVNVYGVAQCTIQGIISVLDHLCKEPQRPSFLVKDVKLPTVVWTSLREAPIIYVNNRPFGVGQMDEPFANLEITGIQPQEVEAMEERLKADILLDASKYNGRILLHEESDDGRIVGVWEEVTPSSVLTLREVYDSIKRRGYKINFNRVPVTDERAPEEQDFNELLRLLKTVTAYDHCIFNCQMGCGRTTTGMVLACMCAIHQYPELQPLPREIALQPKELAFSAAERLGISYHNGDYQIILRLVRVINDGDETKRRTDLAIDSCSVMQNLRLAIEEYKIKSEEAHDNGNMPLFKANFERAISYLERYFYLIAFNAYLREADTTNKGFDSWMSDHKELKSLLQHISLK